MSLLCAVFNVCLIIACSATMFCVFYYATHTVDFITPLYCMQHTVNVRATYSETTHCWRLNACAEKRVFPLQVTLQPKCGRSEIGKRIWQRGLLPKETTLRAPGAQIRQRPGNAISLVPTENRLGHHGHSPKSWLIASTMRKRHHRVAPKSDLE